MPNCLRCQSPSTHVIEIDIDLPKLHVCDDCKYLVMAGLLEKDEKMREFLLYGKGGKNEQTV